MTSTAHRKLIAHMKLLFVFFLFQMLSEAIIHECIFKLLGSYKDLESLEGAARLIAKIGKDVDHPQAKVRGVEGRE